jgi:hypothetical protein
MPCEVTVHSPYSPKEWKKIEKLASDKGKVLASGDAAKKHLAGL